MTTVSVVSCNDYDTDAIRRSMLAALAPLGGIGQFIQPGMRVLLKPNLLSGARLEQAVTTHPAVVQAVAELVKQAGGTVLIGDSPSGPTENNQHIWRKSGMADVAAQTGATLVLFDGVVWKRLNGGDYFIARPVLEADLVINLPKLKAHNLTLYTGTVKNLFGTIPGTRKREVHLRAPGVQDFSRALADVLELVRPGLTIMDGVLGQEGHGPGASGTPRHYGCLAASVDPVALDTVMTHAMGYRPSEVMHLAQAGARGLGVADFKAIQVEGDQRALEFGAVDLPTARWYLRVPAWLSAPVYRAARLQPRLIGSDCAGCGKCAEACPREAILPGKPPRFDLDRCIGCMCCAEVCPQAAIAPKRSLIGRMVGA